MREGVIVGPARCGAARVARRAQQQQCRDNGPGAARPRCVHLRAAGKDQDAGQPLSNGRDPGPLERLQAAVKPAAPGALPQRTDAHVLFAIPPANLSTPPSEVLACPTMRELLGPPRPNPLLTNLEGVWEGRYVSDDDRVALNVMDYASASSTGAAHMCAQPTRGGSSGDGAGNGGSSSGGGSGTTHLALSSGVYGSILASADGLFDSGGSLSSTSLDAQQQQRTQQQRAQQHDVCMPLPPYAMRAGPRDTIYMDPSTVTAAIVTTGNICPGMNDVIEAMVKRLGDYGVPEDNVMGIRYGMRGFFAKDAKPVVLTRDKIEGIHLQGGTILGTSNEHRLRHRHHHHSHHHHAHHSHRYMPSSGSSSPGGGGAAAAGAADTASDSEPPSPPGSVTSSATSSADDAAAAMSAAAAAAAGSSGGGGDGGGGVSYSKRSGSPVFFTDEDRLEAVLDKLEFWRINMLLVIGGQGGNQLGAQLAEGCQRRRIPCCIVGVPKSIDNDVMLVDRTFGFDTVVQEVVARPLAAAKTEAASARQGVGLVKVFGRRAGFIALQASLASGVVDICLIPEEAFELEGPNGMLAYLQSLLEERGHAVICVSEGAGQDLLYGGHEEVPIDEAGNPRLRDIGAHLKAAIKKAIPDADVKYIDPSNMVQAVPCNAADHIFCRVLGFHAVDVAFAGFTGVMVGPVNGHFCMLPSAVVTQTARRVDPRGKNWNRCRAAMGQPRFINHAPTDMKAKAPASAAAAATTAAKA